MLDRETGSWRRLHDGACKGLGTGIQDLSDPPESLEHQTSVKLATHESNAAGAVLKMVPAVDPAFERANFHHPISRNSAPLQQVFRQFERIWPDDPCGWQRIVRMRQFCARWKRGLMCYGAFDLFSNLIKGQLWDALKQQ